MECEKDNFVVEHGTVNSNSNIFFVLRPSLSNVGADCWKLPALGKISFTQDNSVGVRLCSLFSAGKANIWFSNFTVSVQTCRISLLYYSKWN